MNASIGRLVRTLDWHGMTLPQLDGCRFRAVTRGGQIIEGILKYTPGPPVLEEYLGDIEGLGVWFWRDVYTNRTCVNEARVRTITVFKEMG